MEEKDKNSSPKLQKSTGIKVSHEDFIFGKLLGEGSFSSVFLAKHIASDTEYAIKVCEKLLIKREKKIQSVFRERDAMNKLNSNQDPTAPFFVHLAYAFHCDTRLYFAMTYCKNGELLKWLKKVDNFDKRCASFYSGELVKALEHLHKLGIIHRDIKPENIILSEDMHIKVTDFGSAKIFDGSDKDRRSSFVGTPQYVSPEVLESKPVSRSTDLWALGCLIYQLISGLPPFVESTEYLVIKCIQKLDYKFPDAFDKDAKSLVEKLLVPDKENRLGAKDGEKYTSLRSHRFFSDWDLDTIYQQIPPEICGFVPQGFDEETMSWQENMIPGYGPDAIQRLEFGSPVAVIPPIKNQVDSLTSDLQSSIKEQTERIEEQQKSNPYHGYVSNRLIVKQGILFKRKGLFARRRMFLLTTGPRLFYVDPAKKELKGEVPMDGTLRPEAKNFKTFFVHTPNRTYYLIDSSGCSHEWCKALETVRDHYFSNK